MTRESIRRHLTNEYAAGAQVHVPKPIKHAAFLSDHVGQ